MIEEKREIEVVVGFVVVAGEEFRGVAATLPREVEIVVVDFVLGECRRELVGSVLVDLRELVVLQVTTLLVAAVVLQESLDIGKECVEILSRIEAAGRVELVDRVCCPLGKHCQGHDRPRERWSFHVEAVHSALLSGRVAMTVERHDGVRAVLAANRGIVCK